MRTLSVVLVIGVVSGMFLMPGAAFAQKKDIWKIICTNKNAPKSCRIEQRLFLNKKVEGNQKNVGQLLNVSVFYVGKAERKPFIVLQLPLGVDLQAGMVMQIDKSRELKAPYMKCTNSGCEVRSLLNKDMLAQLKRGENLKVGFRPYGSKKTMVVNASLSGFTKAYSRLE